MNSPTVSVQSDLERHAAWRAAGVKPLWENETITGAVVKPRRVGVWKWRSMEPLVTDALHIVSSSQAERRVLSLVDPSAREHEFHTTANLNAGLQMLLPGDVARPHRHSANALRFVIAGNGAVTRVDGKVAPMMEGDLVITPAWFWHEHWHEGAEPIVWLDVLDIDIHDQLGTRAFELGPAPDAPMPLDDAAFGTANVVPDIAGGASSPVFRYPLAEALKVVRSSPPARDGSRRARYVNPLTGGPVMSLLDCYLIELEPGITTLRARTNANSVCAVVSGSGETVADEVRIDWEPRDIFSLPSNAWYQHQARERSYLFIVTDREIYRRLGLLTEDLDPAP